MRETRRISDGAIIDSQTASRLPHQSIIKLDENMSEMTLNCGKNHGTELIPVYNFK